MERPLFSRAGRRAILTLFALAFLAILVLQIERGRQERIAPSPELLGDLEEERRELLGRPLRDDERRRLLEEWVDQEVLVREAYRRGLDQGDGVIRHRLVEKMRLVLAEKPGEPGDETLRAFYRENEARYRTPARASFDHVFVGKADESARERLEAWLPALRSGADFRPMGDRFWLGPSLKGVTPAELGRALGDEFARVVFALKPGEWSGPLASVRGLHLVRVAERRDPERASFEDVMRTVREDWFETQERAALECSLRELKKRYRIETPAAAPPPSLAPTPADR